MAESPPFPTDVDGGSDPIERKVQLPGNSTFSISLPKPWALEHGLERGTTMHLYVHDDRVVIGPTPLEESRRTTSIDAGDSDFRAVQRRVRTAYAAGCDRIEIVDDDGLDDATERAVDRTIRGLLGMEVHDADETEMIVKTVLDRGQISLTQTVEQIRYLALEMHADALEAVRTDDETLATQVIARDDDVDRMFAFVTRGFHRGLESIHELNSLETDRPAAFESYRIARQLERIADHAEQMAAVVDAQSSPPSDEVGENLAAIGADARTVVDQALAGEIDDAVAVGSAVRDDVVDLRQTLYADSGPDVHHYGSVLEHLSRTAEYGLNVTDAILEASTHRRMERTHSQ